MSEATNAATSGSAKDKKAAAKAIAEKAKKALHTKPEPKAQPKVEAKPAPKVETKVQTVQAKPSNVPVEKKPVEAKAKTPKGVSVARIAVIAAVNGLGGKDVPISQIHAAVSKSANLNVKASGHQLYHSYKDAPFYLTRAKSETKEEIFSITDEGKKLLAAHSK